MKTQIIMGSGWTYCITCLFLLFTKLCFTSSTLPPAGLSISSNANDTGGLDGSKSTLELDHTYQTQNNTTQVSHLTSNVSTTENILLHQPKVSDIGIKNNDANVSPNFNMNDIPSIDLQDEDEDLSALTNVTSSRNLTTLNIYNATHSKIWQHLISFPTYVVCQFYQGSDNIQKGVKTYFASHKLLSMFLGMAGVLACLLILIYCIYIRQHKEEMFSHHRLYGEGFEDPVLHLDTPVDHLDFFSFRDTELTPAPTPQLKCHPTEAYDTKEDYRVEAPKGTSSDEYPHQIIQMGSIKHP